VADSGDNPAEAAGENKSVLSLADGSHRPAAERNKFEANVEHGAKDGWLSPIPVDPKRQAVACVLCFHWPVEMDGREHCIPAFAPTRT
jgi:hypothetical protein